ncbi:MAG: hypothetical protein PHZ00_05565, partial [Candidatus Peribacteraceae bacterium]|nr:hypothetical protein [Candidatus Peribacteraceae bacterium]
MQQFHRLILDELEEENELTDETEMEVLEEERMQRQHSPEQGPHVPEHTKDSPTLHTRFVCTHLPSSISFEHLVRAGSQTGHETEEAEEMVMLDEDLAEVEEADEMEMQEEPGGVQESVPAPGMARHICVSVGQTVCPPTGQLFGQRASLMPGPGMVTQPCRVHCVWETGVEDAEEMVMLDEDLAEVEEAEEMEMQEEPGGVQESVPAPGMARQIWVSDGQTVCPPIGQWSGQRASLMPGPGMVTQPCRVHCVWETGVEEAEEIVMDVLEEDLADVEEAEEM